MQDLDTLLNWLAQQTDLDLIEVVQSFDPSQQTTLLTSFQNYATLTAPPKMKEIAHITGRQTSNYILLVSQAMPAAPWPRQKTIVTNLLLALLRFILVNTPDPKRPALADYIATVEATPIRPMIEQSIDQAYPILKKANLIR